MTLSRRAHERFEVALPIAVVHAGVEHTGTTKNLSLGGALVTMTKALPYGATVKAKLRLPGMTEDATIDAVVRWVNGAVIGLQFGSLRAKEVRAINQMLKEAGLV